MDFWNSWTKDEIGAFSIEKVIRKSPPNEDIDNFFEYLRVKKSTVAPDVYQDSAELKLCFLYEQRYLKGYVSNTSGV